ncbi:putative porin [Janthinobacterium fluminis]|uniref:Porin n=1 Tax=Janthinobacterium fluminis TaxID=2987524 RepID=A0ABT5K0Z8_9BURK|nr:putative porin [Janthinobacterium fluminis]MDC8757976.1 putative porin [Janthinobacterium fluminis]
MNSLPLPPHRPRRFAALAVASALALMAAGGAAHAQTAAPAESAMVQLIRGLIQSGALAKDAGAALLAQAQTEALAAQQAQRQTAAAAAPGAVKAQAGDVRVPYISETVRGQIRDEIKGEVMAQARAEGWAAPNETPEWTKRIRVEGDVRARSESRFYAGNNSDIEIDWRSLNAGSGYDVNQNSNLALPALLNTRQDRKNLLRARARLGVLADISPRTHAGIRLATGSDDSAVSTTQTLGGGLGKKNIWLDQAWLSYQAADWLKLTAGRFDSPFVASDVLFSGDLNFDGVAARAEHKLAGQDVKLFGTLGLIPLEYSSDSAPSRSRSKLSSQNKWLLGAQLGAQWKINAEHTLRAALAYYDFKNVSGEYSLPCALYAGADGCSTDWSRPVTMQKGNSLMLLRNIALNPLDPASTPQPQYTGLASKFQLLDVNLRWDGKVAGGTDLRVDADYVYNRRYNKTDMWARAPGGIMNNFNGTGGVTQADFRSGGRAYMVQATLGKASPAQRGDWNVLAGYKRIEPDALPDAYNDSTFHGGGTNARGYYVGGAYALDKNTWFGGRWMATREVFGPAHSIDTLQLELNTRF